MTLKGGWPRSTHVADRVRVLRRRRVRRHRSSALSINLLPMIDVTFLLLIFFLVTSTFEKPEGLFAANLPRDSGIASLSLPISPFIVRLTAAGNPGFDDRTPVIIVADDSLAWDHVVGCWNAAVRAGCKTIAFGAGR